uniref:Uncharacterized protein DDB_G0290685-like n=1 Tax=Saccoglossus kowalevskii TaxID=10224 RepID=A0ABM0LZ68_SACKO|nr:PREDICTED: uncharacterized protein DDB_G0290685-like [Saccoglossus kowalevskii]
MTLRDIASLNITEQEHDLITESSKNRSGKVRVKKHHLPTESKERVQNDQVGDNQVIPMDTTSDTSVPSHVGSHSRKRRHRSKHHKISYADSDSDTCDPHSAQTTKRRKRPRHHKKRQGHGSTSNVTGERDNETIETEENQSGNGIENLVGDHNKDQGDGNEDQGGGNENQDGDHNKDQGDGNKNQHGDGNKDQGDGNENQDGNGNEDQGDDNEDQGDDNEDQDDGNENQDGDGNDQSDGNEDQDDGNENQDGDGNENQDGDGNEDQYDGNENQDGDGNENQDGDGNENEDGDGNDQGDGNDDQDDGNDDGRENQGGDESDLYSSDDDGENGVVPPNLDSGMDTTSGEEMDSDDDDRNSTHHRIHAHTQIETTWPSDSEYIEPTCVSNDEDDDNVADSDGWTPTLRRHVVEEFTGEHPGPNVNKADIPTPISAFEKIFPKSLVTKLRRETNAYAKYIKRNKGADKYWAKIKDDDEMAAFLGIMIIMGVDPKGELNDYWSTNTALRNEKISGVMSRNRFQKILQYFHVNDARNDPANISNPAERATET